MINLSYQYKLKLKRRQKMEIEHFLDVCKSVYNYALKERKDWINSRKLPRDRCSLVSEYIISADAPYPNYNNQAKSLTKAKKTNWRLRSVHSQVLQQTLLTLDKAFIDMKSLGFGFPRFKKALRSFLFPALSGKKKLNERIHQCQYCGYTTSRDVCSAEVIRNRGIIAVGQTVIENACGDDLAGVKQRRAV